VLALGSHHRKDIVSGVPETRRGHGLLELQGQIVSFGGFLTAMVKNLQIVFYGAQRKGQRGEYSR
jgi:hypothetical protein